MRTNTMRNALPLAAALLLASALAAFPQAQLAQTLQQQIARLQAKDSHQDFTVAAQPYPDEKAAKTALDKLDPVKAGLLAVEVFFQNNSRTPLHVNLRSIRLNVKTSDSGTVRLEPLTVDQAASDIAHPKGASGPKTRRIPGLPIPIHDDKQNDAAAKLQPLTFQSDIVPPGGTIHGFLFFDMNRRFDLVPDSSLFVPDVMPIGSTAGLIFFEVHFGASAPVPVQRQP